MPQTFVSVAAADLLNDSRGRFRAQRGGGSLGLISPEKYSELTRYPGIGCDRRTLWSGGHRGTFGMISRQLLGH